MEETDEGKTYPPQSASGNQNNILPQSNLAKLTNEFSDKEYPEQEVQKILQDMAEDFVENISVFACKLAQHRGNGTLDQKDVRLAISKLYDLNLPS